MEDSVFLWGGSLISSTTLYEILCIWYQIIEWWSLNRQIVHMDRFLRAHEVSVIAFASGRIQEIEWLKCVKTVP